MDNNRYEYQCDGKCRICAYPGSLCKAKNTVVPDPVSHKPEKVVPISPDLLQEIKKHIGG